MSRAVEDLPRKEACVESGSQISVNFFRLTSVVLLAQAARDYRRALGGA